MFIAQMPGAVTTLWVLTASINPNPGAHSILYRFLKENWWISPALLEFPVGWETSVLPKIFSRFQTLTAVWTLCVQKRRQERTLVTSPYLGAVNGRAEARIQESWHFGISPQPACLVRCSARQSVFMVLHTSKAQVLAGPGQEGFRCL